MRLRQRGAISSVAVSSAKATRRSRLLPATGQDDVCAPDTSSIVCPEKAVLAVFVVWWHRIFLAPQLYLIHALGVHRWPGMLRPSRFSEGHSRYARFAFVYSGVCVTSRVCVVTVCSSFLESDLTFIQSALGSALVPARHPSTDDVSLSTVVALYMAQPHANATVQHLIHLTRIMSLRHRVQPSIISSSSRPT